MSVKSAFAACSLRRFVYAAGLLGMTSTYAVLGALPSNNAESVAQENWRESIANKEVPGEGCFMATLDSSLGQGRHRRRGRRQ